MTFVRTAGKIDLAASLLAFEASVALAIEQEEKVGEIVLDLFRSHKGAVIDMASLSTVVSSRMSDDLKEIGKLTLAVKEYVKRNQGSVADYENGLCLFSVTRGPGEGTRLWEDTSAEFRAKAHAKL